MMHLCMSWPGKGYLAIHERSSGPSQKGAISICCIYVPTCTGAWSVAIICALCAAQQQPVCWMRYFQTTTVGPVVLHKESLGGSRCKFRHSQIVQGSNPVPCPIWGPVQDWVVTLMVGN
jgi:hypothetical protein